MSVKRTKFTDGLFVRERLTFDLTKPMSASEIELFKATFTGLGEPARVGRLEAFMAQCPGDSPPVAMRLERLRDTLALVKVTHTDHNARLALLSAAELMRRDIEALPYAQKGVKFQPGKPEGAAGPIRKLIRRMLKTKRCQTMTARELWDACAALPERQRMGIEFSTARDAWVPSRGNVSFRRFANVISEERKAPT